MARPKSARREQEILTALRFDAFTAAQWGCCPMTASALAEMLEVSLPSLRRKLKELVAAGKVVEIRFEGEAYNGIAQGTFHRPLLGYFNAETMESDLAAKAAHIAAQKPSDVADMFYVEKRV